MKAEQIIYQLAIHEAWKQGFGPRPEPVRPRVSAAEWNGIKTHPNFLRLVEDMKKAGQKLFPRN